MEANPPGDDPPRKIAVYEESPPTALHRFLLTKFAFSPFTHLGEPPHHPPGELRIAAAWEYTGRNGTYFFVSFDDPSFSSGKYYLSRNRGVENGWTLSFERPREKKDNTETKQAA